MTNDNKQDKSLVQVLKENEISITILNDENHPDFYSQKERLTHIIKSGQITEKRIETLSKIIPSANEAFREISNNAANSQISAFEMLKSQNTHAYAVIEKIVEKANTDEILKEALHTTERMHTTISVAGARMNEKNNNTFKYIAGAIFSGLLLVAGGAIARNSK